MLNKHQKVEVKVHREFKNRNPRINLRSANTLRNCRKSSLVLESKRANRPQLSRYIDLERVAGVTSLKLEGASPRHAAPYFRRRRSLSWARREDKAPSTWRG